MPLQWCQSPTTIDYLFWLSFAISLPLLLLNLILSIRSIIGIKKYRIGTVHKLCITMYLVFVFSGILSVMNITFCLLAMNVLILIRFFVAALIFYMFGLIIMSWLYLLRIYHRFVKTPFAISASLFSLFAICFIIQILSLCFIAYFLLSNQSKFAFISYVVFAMIDVISKMFLLYIFATKVYVSINQIATDDDHSSVKKTTPKIELSKTISSTTKKEKPFKMKSKIPKRNKIVAKTIRDSICAMIAFISSNVLHILCIYMMLISDNLKLSGLHFYLTLITMDQTINIICLYLQHKHGMMLYNKYCSKLHGYILNLFSKNKDKRDGNEPTETELTTNTTTSDDITTTTLSRTEQL